MALCRCGKEGYVGFKHIGVICPKCLERQIEKRYRKETRMNSEFTPGVRLAVLDDGSAGAFVNSRFLERIATEMPMEIRMVKRAIKRKGETLVLALCADDVGNDGLIRELGGKAAKAAGIAPLRVASREEIQMIAKEMGYKGSDRGKRLLYQEFLDECENRYPGTKIALGKAVRILDRLK